MTPSALFQPTARPLSLYPHQETIKTDLRDALRRLWNVTWKEKGRRPRIILCAAPGFGKSETAADMLRETARSDPAKWSMFTVHRRTLVDQFSDRLAKYGIAHGVMMSDSSRYADPAAFIQVASIDTVDSWYSGKRPTRDLDSLPPYSLLVYDEAHTHIDKFARLAERYPEAACILLTATPVLANGGGMGDYADAIVYGPPASWLMSQGYLVPSAKYYGPECYDYSGVRKTSSGEWNEDDAEAVVNRPEIIGNIVEHYAKLGESQPFVFFGNSVAHSVAVRDAFRELGYRVEHIDANTPDSPGNDQRGDIYRRLRAGELDGVCNYGILDRGFDAPNVSVCILGRKIRNVTTYLQMTGRVFRSAEGKAHCIIIDHGGNVAMHGFFDEAREWSLEPAENQNERDRKQRESAAKPITCPECKHIFQGRASCPVCGWKLPERVAKGEAIIEADGRIVEINRDGNTKATRYTTEEKSAWYRQMLYICRERGNRDGAAYHWFRDKFGHAPSGAGYRKEIEPPTPEVRAYVKHQLIRFAKAKARARQPDEAAA